MWICREEAPLCELPKSRLCLYVPLVSKDGAGTLTEAPQPLRVGIIRQLVNFLISELGLFSPVLFHKSYFVSRLEVERNPHVNPKGDVIMFLLHPIYYLKSHEHKR